MLHSPLGVLGLICPLTLALTQEPKEAEAQGPQTVAETSGYTRSSTLAEVQAFLGELKSLPAADRLSTRVFGQTNEGRDLIAVTASLGTGGDEGADEGGDAPFHVLVNANIHGGEIEGKVAVQMLLREIALGEHEELLETLSIVFVPVFNADGNDRIARTNRVTQNGPDGGVGERANAQGLDLNRDFVKLETPEVRALTKLMNELDPIAFMDLHTTNGSGHGYDLTYATSLSPNAERSGLQIARALLSRVGATLLARDGFHIFDYGNFSYAPRKEGSRGERGDPVAWSTYDSRPRFGTNMAGIRGSLAILSEAYSYLPYERRVVATRAFTLECLRELSRSATSIEGERQKARASAASGLAGSLGVAAELAPGKSAELRVTDWTEEVIDLDPDEAGIQPGTRRIAGAVDTVRLVSMEVKDRFKAARSVSYGKTFAVLDPSPELIDVLKVHLGSPEPFEVLDQPRPCTADVFMLKAVERSQRVFQGHREVSVQGDWQSRELTLPPGTILVPASPLVAHLLHPESDDSVGTWNMFDHVLFPGQDQAGSVTNGSESGKQRMASEHPVLLLR